MTFEEALQTGWLSGVRSVDVDRTAEIAYVGEPNRILFLGQAPTQSSTALEAAFSGHSGRRLRELVGAKTEGDFRERFDAVNVLPFFPGKNGASDRFPLQLAGDWSDHLMVRSNHAVVLGGAARVYGLDRLFQYGRVDAGRGVAFPHPSGLNRWWNSPCNQDFALAFVGVLCSRLEEVA